MVRKQADGEHQFETGKMKFAYAFPHGLIPRIKASNGSGFFWNSFHEPRVVYSTIISVLKKKLRRQLTGRIDILLLFTYKGQVNLLSSLDWYRLGIYFLRQYWNSAQMLSFIAIIYGYKWLEIDKQVDNL